MRLDEITQEDLKLIHRMYELHCGSPGTSFEERTGYSPLEVCRELRSTGGFTYIVGSRWGKGTKLLAVTGKDGNVNFHAFEDQDLHLHKNYTELVSPNLTAFREASQTVLNKN